MKFLEFTVILSSLAIYFLILQLSLNKYRYSQKRQEIRQVPKYIYLRKITQYFTQYLWITDVRLFLFLLFSLIIKLAIQIYEIKLRWHICFHCTVIVSPDNLKPIVNRHKELSFTGSSLPKQSMDHTRHKKDKKNLFDVSTSE